MDKEQSIQASFGKNEKSAPGWGDLAVEAIRIFANKATGPFRIEDVRRANPDLEEMTTSSYGWGYPAQKAAALGYIVKHDEVAESDRPTSHNLNVTRWIPVRLAPSITDRLIKQVMRLPIVDRERLLLTCIG